MARVKLLAFLLVVPLLSCMSAQREMLSSDCTGAIPAGFTRIYIGNPSPGGQQSGTSAQDPLDGTTADKFDTILRTIAEGQRPTWGAQAQIPPENLIVCIGPGVFHTNGEYDWVIGQGHTQGAGNVGFTVEKNWRIHGQGTHRTLLQLDGFVTKLFQDRAGNSFAGGTNTVIGTHSDDASGVEISDLTINVNHDNLNRTSGLPLNLDAIVLRSLHGGHWIHDVNIGGASGDLAVRNILNEGFPVQIGGDSQDLGSAQSQGNVIERVRLTHPGRAVDPGVPAGGSLTAISMVDAGGEVRNNLVDGYFIAYGGFAMQSVWFHDNVGVNNRYGFNADTHKNFGVVLQANQFINPAFYGIVIGGSSTQTSFSKWEVLDNTIEIGDSDVTGIVLTGQVQNSVFAGNKILVDHPGGQPVTAIWSFPSGSGVANLGNVYEGNRFDSRLLFNFSQDPFFNLNCRIQNRDLEGNPLPQFPDNTTSATACAAFETPGTDIP